MPRRNNNIAPRPPSDRVAATMAALLPLHSALTLDWLVDAASTAAERALDAPFAFVYLEDQNGRLDRKLPASDVRRRTVQRAADALGKRVLPARIDPTDAPRIAEALDAEQPLIGALADVFGDAGDVPSAAKTLGVSHAAVAPLETAGERLGALVLLLSVEPDPQHVRLFAQHVACAAVNLRQAQSAREHGVIDVVRSVFDARKLESELQRELARADRYRHEVSIVTIEATNMRLLREQFGRFLPERLLQRLGETLAAHAREIDIIGAWKESGYAMILTQAAGDGAAAAARRLLAAALETRLEGDDVPGLELHLVSGWATCPSDGRSSDALVAAAERRMYSAAA
jgi:diguanylate cyclase (GGDEF)-like protein